VINDGAGATCPSNVFWQVGSSATLGTGSTFRGNILALTSITLTTGTTLNGRSLARNGAVTLDSNTIALCAAASASSSPGVPTVNFAGMMVMLALMAGAGLFVMKRG
jgi:hypothetical protein